MVMDRIRYPFQCYMRFYPDSPKQTLVVWQYAKPGAKTLPFYTRFANGQIDQDKQGEWQGIGQVPFGPLRWGIKPKVSSLAGTAPTGTAAQFAGGVSINAGLPQPACLGGGKPPPEGTACGTGCPVCPRISPIWFVDVQPFAGFVRTPVVKQNGCIWSSQCVSAPPVCARGTAAAWEVVSEKTIPGITDGVITYRGSAQWANCCASS